MSQNDAAPVNPALQLNTQEYSMNVIRTAAVAAVMGLSVPAFAQTQPASATSANCAAASEPQIAALFERWNDSLRTLDPDKVLANYAPDAVLLPTIANQPHTTPAEIRAYFVRFLESGPKGKIDKRIVKIGCNVVQDVGTYTFTFKDGKKVRARYTYVYEWQNGKWLIAHHHSSAMPEVAGL